MFFCAIGLVALARAIRRERLSATWLLAGCAAAALLHQAFRLISVILGDDLRDALLSDVGFAWVGLVATALTLLIAIAQITVNAQRVTADLERARRDLEVIAATDALTGALNRRGFMAEMTGALDLARRHDRPLAFLMGDLDHFKAVNDRFGHAMGDQVLARVGAVLRDIGRSSDRIGRLGGEEFGVLLAETGENAATAAAERIRGAIAALPPFDPGPERITISLGAAVFDPLIDDVSSLIARADRALYQAKAAGRDRWILLQAPSEPLRS